MAHTLDFNLVAEDSWVSGVNATTKTIRADGCVHDIMSMFVDEKLLLQKVELRKKARGIQSTLKTYEIKPDDLGSDALARAFQLALQMKL